MIDDTCLRPEAHTSAEVGAAPIDPFSGPADKQLDSARGLRAAWDQYRAQVSWLCTVLDETALSAGPTGKAWNRESRAALVEQHDVLIRRLGDWPALEVWNADLAVAVRAAEAQLASLLSAWLTLDPTLAAADERMRMALIAEDVRLAESSVDRAGARADCQRTGRRLRGLQTLAS
ncbi:hypothetical protein [Streptomyces chiangmaiensis]|uniref:DUF4254 domain-containing protein n=1 Tax=Streptomyces chiangmaiensis TaxID=766497 RepID=A0ABU7FUI3_9ACTN|nr:hypothetical protein [Streptomyces chiangmaiensis]MED7826764.1 hypothetical protein [Streptomyces chiangmaiensis]